MHPKKHSSGKSIILALAIAVPMFCIGIFIFILSVSFSNQALYEEYDSHLGELASTIDHNIALCTNRCSREMNAFLADRTTPEGEALLLATGSSEALEERLDHTAELLSEYIYGILVRQENELLYSTGDVPASFFFSSSPKDDSEQMICVDNATGRVFLALPFTSGTPGVEYLVLMDPEVFFQRVVTDRIYGDYWIVLYHSGTGAAIQNDDTQPACHFLTEEEIARRSDGYAVIASHEKTDTADAESYVYTKDGVNQTVRIYTLPKTQTENGLLTVAVSAYNYKLLTPLRYFRWLTILAGVLILGAAGTFIFLLLHSRKKQKELQQELDALERQKDLNAQVLKQQEDIDHRHNLETIGTLTAGISHEFNNLLAPIMGNSILILEKSRTQDPEIFENALAIYESSDKAKNLISRVTKLSRTQSAARMEPLSPTALMVGMLALAEPSIPKNITIRKEYRAVDNLLGDEDQLISMLLNLVVNAVQAMKPEAGTLTLTTDSDEDYIYISVADTGKGIDPAVMDRLFDPFFTTKEVGKGTGLGLSIARSTVSAHGGTIRGENLPEGGAKFTVTFHIFKQ